MDRQVYSQVKPQSRAAGTIIIQNAVIGNNVLGVFMIKSVYSSSYFVNTLGLIGTRMHPTDPVQKFIS